MCDAFIVHSNLHSCAVRIIFQDKMLVIGEPDAKLIWNSPSGSEIPGFAANDMALVYGTNFDLSCTLYLWLLDEKQTTRDTAESATLEFTDSCGNSHQALSLKICREKYVVLSHLAMSPSPGRVMSASSIFHLPSLHFRLAHPNGKVDEISSRSIIISSSYLQQTVCVIRCFEGALDTP